MDGWMDGWMEVSTKTRNTSHAITEEKLHRAYAV
jgi:hypothetical protein